MESTLYATTSLFTISKTLNSTPNRFISRIHRHLCTARQSQCIRGQLRRLFNSEVRASHLFGSVSCSSNSLRSLSAVVVSPVGCAASSAASFAYGPGGGGGGIGGNGGGGGGDEGSDGGKAESKSGAGGTEEGSALSPDVIIIDVGGMTCGGCAASVKRILENQPQVLSASVNLATETAIVWPATEAKVVPNWHNQLGETLAKHLTNCGFKSNLRGQGAIEGEIPS